MKKSLLLVSLFFLGFSAFAQSKITFEDQTASGAAIVSGGSVSVVANPEQTGINTSGYCLDVVNDAYAAIKFSGFSIPAGAAASYPYVILKFKIAYKADNGGTDLDYPILNVFSSPATPTLGASEKVGEIGNAWGTHDADLLVWKNAQFTMSSSVLASIPAGELVLQVAKAKCEYLIDDVELVPSPVYGNNILTLFDFENNALDESFPTANIYGGTVASTAAVVANPTDNAGKSLRISPADYNQVASLSVTLPNNTTLADYNRLYFDKYSDATLYAQLYVYANTTKIYRDESGYPSQGAEKTWIPRDFELNSMPAVNSFTLYIGYSSLNSDASAYIFDNIKLSRANVTSTNPAKDISPLAVRVSGSSLMLNQTVDKIAVFDLNGHSLITDSNVSELNIDKLSKGIYIVKSTIKGDNYINKIMK